MSQELFHNRVYNGDQHTEKVGVILQQSLAGDTDKNQKEESNHQLYVVITTRKKISWMTWGRWVGWSREVSLRD